MKILIAEQHPITQKGIYDIVNDINPEFDIVPFATSNSDLIKKLKVHSPKILILELELPGINGIQTIKEIKEKYRGIKIFIFSRQPEEIYALSTIKSGASAYLCKSASIDVFKTALKRVIRGGIYLNEQLSNQLNERNYKRSHYNTFKKLSTREVEVLNLLSVGTRNKEIANKLAINEKTVSTYKTRLLKKLKVDNIADLINQSRILHLY